jgi:hypothetical protein
MEELVRILQRGWVVLGVSACLRRLKPTPCYEAGAKHIRIFGALRRAGLRPGLDGRMRPSFHEIGRAFF